MTDLERRIRGTLDEHCNDACAKAARQAILAVLELHRSEDDHHLCIKEISGYSVESWYDNGEDCPTVVAIAEALGVLGEADWQGRGRNIMNITGDARWRLLKPIDRRVMKVLLDGHDPQTGAVQQDVSAVNLTAVLDVTEETLRRARLRLIDTGLIVSYEPGTGHATSTYRIARSWDEAERACAAREREGTVASNDD